jgi:hypothetical protein
MAPIPFWYKLVNQTSYSGLTLPYIVGATAYISKKDPSINDIPDIVNEMASLSLPKRVCLRLCSTTLNEYVFFLNERFNNYSLGKPLNDNLFLSDSVKDKANSETELIEFLKSSYIKQITEKTFSKQGFTTWREFNEREYKLFNDINTMSL